METLIHGDCLEKLKEIPDNSIDSIVTDPPYGLSFMGKKWDYDVPSIEIWKECLRVLKPGGHLLSFAGTRTQHRMAVRIEDAGFEIRDMIAWVYSSGFPKSLNVFKQLKKNCTCGNMEAYEQGTKTLSKSPVRPLQESDLQEAVNPQKKQGEVLQSSVSEQSTHDERKEAVAVFQFPDGRKESSLEGRPDLQETQGELQGSDLSKVSDRVSGDGQERRLHNATSSSNGTTPREVVGESGSSAPHRPQSEQQQYREPCAFCKQYGTQATRSLGIGTALKPSHEPITVARKPLSEKTVAENVLTHGTGGLNIDGCRVEAPDANLNAVQKNFDAMGYHGASETNGIPTYNPQGRWPANLIHDGSEEVLECFPWTKSGAVRKATNNGANQPINLGGGMLKETEGSEGSAARFFYCAKASKKDRDEGLDGTRTVKYNGSINPNKELCKEENMVAVQLLQRVISEPELVSFSIGESGVNIMAQCQSGSLSTIKTTISKIIESKILNLLTLSLTSGFTEDASLEKMSGGSHAESVGSLKKWLLTITNGQSALALGASDVALKMLLQIRNEENWNQSRNIHSTVKPTALMRYLVKLVTPPGGTVLDPFTGSGSTGKACKLEGFEFIGIEREEEYISIAKARISAVKMENKLL